ncbi:MAG: hypothetical protein HZA79_02265 [Sphingobacteriales bacterium]|nr:hypothetical protein [Sphingobacteriales bacterium]
MKILVFGLLALVIVTQCNTKPSSDKGTTTAAKSSQNNLAVTQFDTISEQFITGYELMTHDLVELKIIDSSVTSQLSETCYCDTTIRLNDSISYSIISVNDEAGLCTYFFVTSLNNKNGKVIASKYLHSDCDADYSLDTHELHEHLIISKNKIEVSNTTIFQKKNKTSPGQKQNIDRKQTQKSLITISQTGQIK